MNINCQPPLQFVYFSTDTHIPWISHNTLRDRLFKNGVAIRKKVYYETNSSRVCVYVKRLPLLSALLLVSPSSETTSALVHDSTSCTGLSNRGIVVNLNVVWSRC